MNLRTIQRIKTGSQLAAMILFIVTCVMLRQYDVDDKVFSCIFCGLAIVLFVVLFLLSRMGRKLEKETLERMKYSAWVKDSQPLTRAEELLLFDRAVERSGNYAWGGMLLIIVVSLFVWKGVPVDGFHVLIAAIPLCGLWCGGMILYRDKLHARLDQFKSKTVMRGVITRKYTISGEGSDDDSYYLTIEKFTLNVELLVYKKYEIGDAAEFHFYPPLDNHILYDAKLDSL